MTLEDCITKARQLSRTSTSGLSDRAAVKHVNDAQKSFAKDVHGLTKETYLSLSPRFDIQTHFAIGITVTGGTNALAATDVAICATSALDQTGTQVATALQTAIRAVGPTTLTVTWSTTAWKFTIDGIDCTSITLETPSGITYADALDLLGFEAGTTTDTEITGEIPTECNLEITLPDDFLQVIPSPEWDGEPLILAPWPLFTSPGTSGTPSMYAIREKRMRLYPVPNSQKMLHLWYKYIPSDFTEISGYQECGLSGLTLATATGLAATTQYYFKVTAEGVQVEYDITTGTSVSFASVIALMNTECSGVCTWSIEDGDLRCTSDDCTSNSSIALAAGTTGTDLFVTLTDWTAFDTAVAGEAGNNLGIDDEWCNAIAFYVAYLMALGNFEDSVANRNYAYYLREIQKHIVTQANMNPKIEPQQYPVVVPEVNPNEDS